MAAALPLPSESAVASEFTVQPPLSRSNSMAAAPHGPRPMDGRSHGRYTMLVAQEDISETPAGDTIYELPDRRQLILSVGNYEAEGGDEGTRRAAAADGRHSIAPRMASVYHGTGSFVVKSLFVYGAVILLGLVVLWAMDLLLEVCLFFLSARQSYNSCRTAGSAPDVMDDGASSEAGGECWGYTLAGYASLLSFPVLLEFCGILISIAVGFLVDVWYGFEWMGLFKLDRRFSMINQWVSWLVLVGVPLLCFAVACYTSQEPAEIARLVETTVLVMFLLAYLLYVVLLGIAQCLLVFKVTAASNPGLDSTDILRRMAADHTEHRYTGFARRLYGSGPAACLWHILGPWRWPDSPEDWKTNHEAHSSSEETPQMISRYETVVRVQSGTSPQDNSTSSIDQDTAATSEASETSEAAADKEAESTKAAADKEAESCGAAADGTAAETSETAREGNAGEAIEPAVPTVPFTGPKPPPVITDSNRNSTRNKEWGSGGYLTKNNFDVSIICCILPGIQASRAGDLPARANFLLAAHLPVIIAVLLVVAVSGAIGRALPAGPWAKAGLIALLAAAFLWQALAIKRKLLAAFCRADGIDVEPGQLSCLNRLPGAQYLAIHTLPANFQAVLWFGDNLFFTATPAAVLLWMAISVDDHLLVSFGSFCMIRVLVTLFRLFNFERVLLSTDDPSATMEKLETDHGWRTARRGELIRRRILNGKCRSVVQGVLSVAAFGLLALILIQAHALDPVSSMESDTTRMLNVSSVSEVQQAEQSLRPPSCLGNYSMHNMIPGLTVIDYAVLSQQAYISNENYKQLVQPSLDRFFPNGTIKLLNSTNLGRTAPSLRIYQVITDGCNETKGEAPCFVTVVRGTKNPVDWLVNANMWNEAALVRLLRAALPFGALWDPAYPFLINALSLFGSEDTFRMDLGMFDYLDSIAFPEGSRHTVTGHSLGGGLAMIAATRRKDPSVVFSAPNAGLSFQKFNLGAQSDLDKYSINVIPEDDVVPMVDLPPKHSVKIKCRAGSFPFDSIECHSVLRAACELQHTCGTSGRPVIQNCCDAEMFPFYSLHSPCV